MADWTQHLTPAEAQAILDRKEAARFTAYTERGERITRYAAPTEGELARIRIKAGEGR